MKYNIKCPCGNTIYFTAKSKLGRKKYCCKKCFYLYRPKTGFKRGHIFYKGAEKGWFKKGQKPMNYGKGKPYFDKSIGYWKISMEGKDMKYHRYLMEQKLKRKLDNNEVVHHIDNNINNNDLDNLQLFDSKSEHLKYHWSTTRRK